MARYRSRSRSRSYSPRRRSRSPPRGRKRYDDEPRDRRRDRRDPRSPAPSGLLVRNLPLDARPEDLRTPFERYGPVKDVYLPKNYYTGEPRGFGFVKYRYADDAAEAKQQLNHTVIGGLADMEGAIGEVHQDADIIVTYSRSPSPVRNRRSRDDYHSPAHSRSISRSPSRDDRDYKRSPTESPRDDRDYRRSTSPRKNGRSRSGGRGRASSRSRSPRENGRPQSVETGHAPSRSRSPGGESPLADVAECAAVRWPAHGFPARCSWHHDSR
ncbi:Serine/arginine-rich splicing factor 12 [Morus notabilis]|uniref:Serine/arginine-rich splicing factor 12 n=1 Tax=Morus notabilis TaxID=981085 RepID=W9RSB6_9ROSA|nr:Serine/arginine-rich splicing factor 12 [Morus notabilis]